MEVQDVGEQVDLSTEEIWDDSALVDSWNEALAEYKHYHSLHARGEKAENAVRDMDEKEAKLNVNSSATAMNTIVEEDLDNGELEDGEWDGEEQQEGGLQDVDTEVPGKLANQSAAVDSGGFPPAPALPSAVLGVTGGDEGLKNLMMSWYYAGYYTGLYEGQQEAAKATSKSNS